MMPAVMPASPKGLLSTLRHVWRTDRTFRGFVEFALIGGVVLAFLHGLSFDFRTVHQSPTATPQQSRTDATLQQSRTDKSFHRRVHMPRIADVMFDESYFADRPEPMRSSLIEATRALQAKDLARVDTLLQGTDANDRWVLLVRGTAAINSPDPYKFLHGLDLLTRSAAQRDPKAMSILGVLNLVGYDGGGQRDVERGRIFLEMAAATGEVVASRVLAHAYILGWVGRVDFARAVHFLGFAAEHGDAEAMSTYGLFLVRGAGVQKNVIEGEAWLLKAAELGQSGAQSEFGNAKLMDYLNQVTTDAGPAIKWLSLAADQHEPDAMFNLGAFLSTIRASTGYSDPERGAELLRKCSEETLDDRCTFAYATLLEGGRGVSTDLVKAYAFYRLSGEELTTPRTTERLAKLEHELSPTDLDKARAMSREIRREVVRRSDQATH